MSATLLKTKLFVPPPRLERISRLRLIEKLDASELYKLTLVSAPAGYGKTTLVSEWIDQSTQPAAWLSLDEGDNDLTRFLTYFITALQQITPNIGQTLLPLLQSPQPPPIQAILTYLINEIAALSENSALILDDYHVVDDTSIDQALAFLLDHLPQQLHLFITTREDPNLPLARLRAQGHLMELRVADLRFTSEEAALFLNKTMRLDLALEDITALERRTEGWVTGLQLAALAMQGSPELQSNQGPADFIQSFSGSNRYVLDYLVEEVLDRQPENIQTFLLRTSILGRLCAPLCNAVVDNPAISGQEILAYLEQANLFLIPLDNERRWYRYHHLFANLLHQRLLNSDNNGTQITELHRCASFWYENKGMEVEAFQHAISANDIERAECLIECEGTPLYLRGEATRVLQWIQTLPKSALDARPTLWVMYAWVLWITHKSSEVEVKLQSAEAALQNSHPNARLQDIIGNIAAMRAMLAANDYQTDTIIEQANLALENLDPDNHHVRTAMTRTLGIAYHFQGDRPAAVRSYSEAIAMCEATENVFMNILASTGLGMVQELENQLTIAAETYHRVLELVGEPPQPVACEAYLGLARIHYEWNKLDRAEKYANQGIQLARWIEGVDTSVSGEVFLSKLKLAKGNAADAAKSLANLEQIAHQHNYAYQIPRILALRVVILLQQGNYQAANHLIQDHKLPLIQTRIFLAQGDLPAAQVTLEQYRRQMEVNNWQDELLKVMVLQSVVHQAKGEIDKALNLLEEALTLAKPGGFIRLFLDEGAAMKNLLSLAAAQGMMPQYITRLTASFEGGLSGSQVTIHQTSSQHLVEPLSEREFEILELLAQGLTNREIGERLFLAIPTVKGYNRNIYSKLQVHRRMEAVAHAREIGIL